MSNLIFIPKTKEDMELFNNWLNNSDFYAEVNDIENYFSFSENDDCIDKLELDVQTEINKENINGYFITDTGLA